MLHFSVGSDSFKYTLNICGARWQPPANHSPFPLRSAAHIPIWFHCRSERSLSWPEQRVCVFMSLRSIWMHPQCKQNENTLTSSLLRTQTLSSRHPEGEKSKSISVKQDVFTKDASQERHNYWGDWVHVKTAENYPFQGKWDLHFKKHKHLAFWRQFGEGTGSGLRTSKYEAKSECPFGFTDSGKTEIARPGLVQGQQATLKITNKMISYFCGWISCRGTSIIQNTNEWIEVPNRAASFFLLGSVIFFLL